MRKSIRAVSAALIGYGSIPVLAFISAVLTARSFGPVGRGEIAAIQAIPLSLLILVAAGTPQGITYYTAQCKEEGGRVLGTALVISIVALIPTIVVGIILQSKGLSTYRYGVQLAGIIFLSYLPIMILASSPWNSLLSCQHHVYYNVVRAVPQVLYVSSLGLAISLSIEEPEFVVYFYLVALLIFCLPLSWIVYQSTRPARLTFSIKTLRQMLPYCLTSVCRAIPATINQRSAQILISWFLDPEKLGLYVVAEGLATVQVALGSALGSIAFPKLAAQSGGDELRDTFGLILRWGIVMITSTMLMLLFVIPYMLPFVFGAEFAPTISSGLVLCVGGAFSSLNQLLGNSLQGLGRPKGFLIAESVGAMSMILLMPIAILSYGILGAAIVSSLSCILTSVILLVRISRVIPGVLDDWPTHFRTESVGVLRLIYAYFGKS